MKPNICFVCLKTFPKSGKRTGSDLQSKFWKLTKSHLGIETDDGGKSVEESFCGDCGRLVQDVCGLYSELAAVQLRLSYKLGEMGELLQNSKTTVSGKLGQLLIRRLAEQMSFDAAVELDQLRNLLMNKCQLKRGISMPDVRVERMRMSRQTPRLSLPFVPPPQHSASTIPEFKVEYIVVEREDESSPVATHQDHDDYDSNLPSPVPPSSPQPSETEEASSEVLLPKNIQPALDLIPTKNYQGHDLKPKKKYNKKLPDVEPLPKRRKTLVNKSYAEVDEFKDLPLPRTWQYSMKKKKPSSEEEDEYVPPEKMEPHRLKALEKVKDKIKARKITFFTCLLTRVDESGEMFKCSKCDTVLPNSVAVLRAHVVKEHTDRLVCPQCGMKFGKLAYFKAHMVKHKKEGQPLPKTPCNVCGRPCDAYYFKVHRWTHYSEEEKAAALARGEKLPYRKNKKFQCDKCEKNFYSMELLAAHTKKVHEGIAPPPAKRKLCTVCGADVRSLLQHMKHKHSNYQERKFVCATCNKRFVCQNDLNQHKFQAHGTEKPFMCSECGKRFRTRQNMEQHHVNMHVNATVYQCKYCPRQFTRKYFYDRHTMKRHGGGGMISQPEEQQQQVEVLRQEEQKHDVKFGEQQLQAVNLCQQSFDLGVVPMPSPHFFY